MRSFSSAFVLLLASCVSGTTTVPPPVADAVDELFASQIRVDGPGCAFSLSRNGRTELEHFGGLANLEQPSPISPETVFEAGSVSKQFTAAAIAVLAGRGQLSLDDDIRKFLPEFRSGASSITIRMLLTHTSGIRNWDDLVELAGRPREDASGLSQADAFNIIVRQTGLNFAPGSEYLYSNSNYVLAVAIVERVSGRTFSEFTARELFTPLGMTHTQWRDDYTRVVPGRATAYTPGDDGVRHIDMPLEDVIGPGGMLTTVRDLQRWNARLSESTSDTPAWVLMLRNERGSLSDGTAIAYGLGLERESVNGQEVISHAGATGGYRTYLAQAPDFDLSAALLCNDGALNTEDLGPKLLGAFLPTVERSSNRAPFLTSGVHDKDLAGRYRNTATRQIVDVTVDQAGVHFNGGPAFIAVAPGKLSNADGTRSAAVERAGDRVSEITLDRIGNSPVRLVPAPDWVPDAASLLAFAGEFYSADIEAGWRVSLDGPTLRATGPKGQTFRLDPLYQDAFSARDAYWTLVFERDAKGVPTAVSMFKTRTRGVRFARTS